MDRRTLSWKSFLPKVPGETAGTNFTNPNRRASRKYWRIDPFRQQIDFYELAGMGAYTVVMSCAEGCCYASKILSGSWRKIEWLWQKPVPEPRRILGAPGSTARSSSNLSKHSAANNAYLSRRHSPPTPHCQSTTTWERVSSTQERSSVFWTGLGFSTASPALPSSSQANWRSSTCRPSL